MNKNFPAIHQRGGILAEPKPEYLLATIHLNSATTTALQLLIPGFLILTIANKINVENLMIFKKKNLY